MCVSCVKDGDRPRDEPVQYIIYMFRLILAALTHSRDPTENTLYATYACNNIGYTHHCSGVCPYDDG